jgi:hypothetical protein
MAAGDIVWFRQALLDLGTKKHDLSADTIKIGLTIGTTTPSATTGDPRWGTGGTTNFATEEVATGTSYSAGGPALTSVSWTLVSNVPTFRGADVVINQDASGFTNGRYGIVYNSTDAGKRALGYIDLGSSRSIQTGSLTINFGGAGTDIFTITTP